MLDAVVTRFADVDDPARRALAAHAQMGRTVNLRELGRMDEAVAAYEAIFEFGEAALPVWATMVSTAERDPTMRAHEAQARFGQARTFRDLNRRDDAIAALDHLIRRFGDDPSEALLTIVDSARRMRDELR